MSEPVAFLQACAHSLQHLLGGAPQDLHKKSGHSTADSHLFTIRTRQNKITHKSVSSFTKVGSVGERAVNRIASSSRKNIPPKRRNRRINAVMVILPMIPPTVFQSEPRSPKSILKRLAISGVPLSCEIVLAKLHCKKTFLKLKHLQSFFPHLSGEGC